MFIVKHCESSLPFKEFWIKIQKYFLLMKIITKMSHFVHLLVNMYIWFKKKKNGSEEIKGIFLFQLTVSSLKLNKYKIIKKTEFK